MFCRNCGKEINDTTIFCPYCGTQVSNDAEPVKVNLGFDNPTQKKLSMKALVGFIVAMAGNLEASVMAVTICKELGVKTVIAKASSVMHQKILERVGADIVVFPENESGVRLAKNLLSSGFVDMITLSKDFSMVELDVRPEWIGKSLMELNLRKKHAINVVAIKRAGRLEVNIDPMEKLSQDSSLIVIANPQKLAKLK